MSNAKKCDRCGRFYLIKDISDGCTASIREFDNTNYVIRDMDLCPDCSEKLERWLSLKKEELNNNE